MKKFYKYTILIFFILISAFTAKAQWDRVSLPYPFDEQMYYWLDVYFLESNPDYGWICGRQGAILRTTDGGETWDGIELDKNYQLESIHFVNENVGYCSGLERPSIGKIFKTTNGGLTWNDITPDGAIGLWGNFFINENTGLVIGNGCTQPMQFFRTEDGGQTWDLFTTEIIDSGLCDLILYSENGEGYATSSGMIWQTMDGGRTWDIFSVSGDRDWQEEISRVNGSFLVPYSPFCSGGSPGGVRFSTDNGNTWKEHFTGVAMFGTFLHDELRGWGAGWDETVIYTSDGGDNWVNRNCGILDGDELDDLYFIDDSTGWVVGDHVYRFEPIKDLDPEILSDGPLEFCEGESVNLFTSEEYNYYRWSNNSVSDTINITKSGTYWVSVNNSMCDTAFSEKVKVTVHPKPEAEFSLSEPYPFCEGDTIELSLTEEFDSYDWSTGENSSKISITVNGTYSVIVTNEFGCLDTAYFEAVFEPKPDPEIEVIGRLNSCVGDTVILKGNPGYSIYEWYKEPADTPFETGKQEILVTESGNYYLYVETESGCSAYSEVYEITMAPDSNRIEILYSDDSGVFDFDSTRFLEQKCLPVIIRNIGPDPVIIDDAYMFSKTSFSIPESQFEIYIAPYDTSEIIVCYTPSKLGDERDTIRFEDRCGPQFIPLKAIGASNIYEGPSKCEVDMEMESFAIDKNYIFSTDLPIPNPSRGIIEVPFHKISKDGNENESFHLMNILGEKICQGNIMINKEITIDEKYHQSGVILFECEQLPAGMYLIMINTTNSTRSYPVIIDH